MIADELKIGFIGAGQMAHALAGGLTQKSIVRADQIWAADAKPEAVESLCQQLGGGHAAESNVQLIGNVDVIVLAIKPQNVPDLISELSNSDGGIPPGDKLFISIVAGLTCERLERGLQSERVVRVMPNTPCLIGEGMSAFACGSGATSEDAQLVQLLLDSVGLAVQVDEPSIDAVTGLSGSGPAFVFQFIEGLIDGGIESGLSPEVARQLAVQTVRGAATLVRESTESPAELTARVASPNGTTEAGLHVLKQKSLKTAVATAVAAATNRSIELGQE